MNSVLGIGEHIIFIDKGHKAWEGSSQEITTSNNKALDDFIFATPLFKDVKGYLVSQGK
jgi:phospholipid/cholesterol/gamma-HCH transport system ATP-binding protein